MAVDAKQLETSLRDRVREANRLIKAFDGKSISFKSVYAEYGKAARRLRPFVANTTKMLHEALAAKKEVLFEGAQGTMLDIDHGSYPYVTSSSPTIGGACTGLGISPQSIAGVLGVFKAYSTRVGSGPMPSELHGESAENLREIAHEYGTTTGRARRVGWFDAVAGRYSKTVNGMTGFVLTRLDILDGFESVKICNGYRASGREMDRFPSNTSLLAECEAIYEELPGWDKPTAGATTWDELPENAKTYVNRIQELIGCPAQIISTGPNREETILIKPIIS